MLGIVRYCCLLSTSWQQSAHIITVLIPGERGGNREGKEKAERTKNIEPRNCHIANMFRPVNDLSDLT